MKLPEEFLREMEERLGKDFPAFLQSYETPLVKSIRVNTLKISAEAFGKISPFALSPVPWEENGFYIDAEKTGGNICHHAGLFYSQEASAMFPATLLGVREGERVLDLCAAPGGKSGQLAQALNGTGILVCNEYDYSRARILSENVERLGVKNCAVVNAEPSALAEGLSEYFDKVLVDAPCSGEGMFKREEAARQNWSKANVRGCAVRQAEIIESAARLVRVGGSLVYSTCTFSEEENEGQIEAFLARHSEFELISSRTLFPHEVKGEGQFAALLKKKDGGQGGAKTFPVARNRNALRAFYEFAKEFFTSLPEGEITVREDGRMYLVPEGMPRLSVRMLRVGVELGTWDGKLFKPAHALVMSGRDFSRYVPLTAEESVKYLRGEPVACNLPNGWCAAGAEGFPLGLGKVVNGVMKNHYPKGLRIR